MRMLKSQIHGSLPCIKIVVFEFETTRFSVRAQKIIWLWTGASNVNLNVQGSSKLHSIVTNCVWFTQYLKSPPPVPSSICLPWSSTVENQYTPPDLLDWHVSSSSRPFLTTAYGRGLSMRLRSFIKNNISKCSFALFFVYTYVLPLIKRFCYNGSTNYSKNLYMY